MRPLVIGHRGAMAVAPENTLASFDRALDDGADGIECDVHLSRDGQVIVLHDFTLDRTTTGTGPIAARDFEELADLDAGRWFDPRYAGEPVPHLEQVIAMARAHGARRDTPPRLVVELKAGSRLYPGIEEAVLDVLRAGDYLEHALLISFDHAAIRHARSFEPRINAGVLYYAQPVESALLARAADAQWLGPSTKQVTTEEVAAAHAAGLQVFGWTCESPEEACTLAAMGLDAFGANDPATVLAALGRSPK